MYHYVQSLTFRKTLGVTVLVGAVVFLFMYSDNTLNGYYYDDGFLEFANYTNNNFTDKDEKYINKDYFASSALNISTEDWDNTNLTSRKDDLITIQPEIHGNSSRNLHYSTEAVSTLSFPKQATSNAHIGNSTKRKSSSNENKTENSTRESSITNDYLVWSPECKIPNFSPFSKQAMRFYHKEKYISCSKHKLLSYVNISDNKATLHIDKATLHSYTKENISCCFSNVNRHGSKKKPDDGIKFTTCTPFQDFFNITHDTFKVSCKTKKQKTVYENVHQSITVKEKFLNSKRSSNSTQLPSILFVGIDSISRLNLIRAMPKTYNFLANRSETWLPLYGYNKIGENTFPNLMAIFTGYNDSEAYKICNPKKIGPLDSCRFIWKDYKKFGYITAYAEDESTINTFNYRKKGFTKEPVDYYFKPYMEAAESLGTVKQDSLSICAGPESSGERIMNLAKNFAITYKDYTTFGFFWMNTFSHNNLKTPSRMDEKVANLLEDITDAGILDNSILIFLSDHGLRFGEIRYTFTGWLEERLPYIFFSFPKWFKEKYPQEIINFQLNANRLTTPYDLHITLQHILVLAGFNHTITSIDACPLCRSLFTEIGLNRSCETTGITPHWCTCGGYSKLDQKERTVIKAANFLIEEVGKIIVHKGGSKKCAKFHLSKVLTSYISDQFSYKNDTYLLIAVETIPKAIFESTLHYKTDAKNNTVFSIDSSISRLDSYNVHAHCVSDERLKEYCFCK